MAVADDKKRFNVTVAEETAQQLDKLGELLGISRASAAGLLLDGITQTERGLKLLATKIKNHRSRDVWQRQEKASRPAWRRALKRAS